MKSTLGFVILILSSFSAFATVYHSDGSDANVQLIHDIQAIEGDTITLPAGTFSWTIGVRITKAITIQGQTTVNSDNGTANDLTVLMDNLTYNGGSHPFFSVSVPATKPFRMTGITFTAGSRQQTLYNGAITVAGQTDKVRLDHLHFTGPIKHNNYIAIYSTVYGVADHIVLDGMGSQLGQNRVFNGTGNGDLEFSRPADYGSGKFFFFEDFYINNTFGGGSASGGIDSARGAKFVVRHCKLFNAVILCHGTELDRTRGGRAQEFYNNEYHWTYPNGLDGLRSGTMIAHDNTFIGTVPDGYSLQTYRLFNNYGSLWLGASGATGWDVNVTEPDGTHVDGHPPYVFQSGTVTSATSDCNSGIMTLTDTSKNWTPNQWAYYTALRLANEDIGQIISNTNNTLTMRLYGCGSVFNSGDQYRIHKVLIALDQPGRGQGDLISGDNPPPVWPHQQLEPCYSWNNIHSPSGEHINFSPAQSTADTVRQGRDYFNDTPMPGYTPYAYPHPLVTGGSPTPTPTPSFTPLPTPTAIPTATPTPTPTPTATPTPTSTSTPIATPTGTPAPTATPGPDLVVAYAFDEGSGTTLTDASGNGITGNIIGATWTTEGRNGNALSFNGSSSYVDLGNPALLQITGSMTMSAWVQAAANPADDGQIVAKADDASGWQLKTSPDTGPHTFGVRVAGATNTFARRYSTTVRSLNVWYHVAGVYDASAQTLDTYVNGVLDNGTLRGIIPAVQLNAAVNVNIGRRTSLYRGYYFNGVIDDLRIYNRALSQAEIQADMNTPVGSPPPTPTPTSTATSTPTATATSTPTATPIPDQCEVPNFIGVKFNHAQGTWNDAGFTTEVIILPRLDNPNYISWQSLPEGFIGSCSDTTIIVQ